MKPGDLLYLKSSEEPVVVINPGVTDSPNTNIIVRRPQITQNGTEYMTAEFFRFELETPEEQDLRKIEDIKRRHILTQQATKDVPQQLGFDMTGPVDPNAIRN